jgi:formyltetrahydrofolate-dependent phosphoribosylglycinamide formyltransferase
MGHKAPVAVLISGTGTNMAALIYAAKHPDCPYEIVLVASNNADAPGLTLAEAEGMPTFAHTHTGLKRAEFDAILDTEIRKSGAQFIALAGYMRLLSPGFIADWQGRIVNIHPSLLPAHKGLHTHEAVLAAGEQVTGCTVHVVTEALDDGPVLGQTHVAVIDGDTPETLAARVLIAEHQLYSRCLAAFVQSATGPEALIAQIRSRAMALPEADEVTSHGMPCWGIIKGKKFAYVSNDHHGDGKVALLVKISGVEEQANLIENDPDRYYRPAYFGDGWVGIRLDLGDNDWDHIGEWLARSWRAVAPPRLTKLMSVADEF